MRERIDTIRPFAPANRRTVDPGLGAKVAFLSRTESYAEPTERVEVVETHMSWVFLTDTTAWKLKKPVRSRNLDFSTEAARRANCEEELRLNRRLSAGRIPWHRCRSRSTPGVACDWAKGDTVVDWLVKMRRLPGERMLDRLLARALAAA